MTTANKKTSQTKTTRPKAAPKAAEPDAVADSHAPKSPKRKYVSLAHEGSRFAVNLGSGRIINGVWNSTRDRVIWFVDEDDVEAFEAHHFFKTQRIIRSDV